MSATNLEQGQSQIVNRVRQVIDDAPESVEKLDRGLQKFTTDRPLLAAVIALTAGYLVARMLARKF